MLGTDDKEYVKDILVNDDPFLYLGAGFSYGAKNKDGKTIPCADELKTIVLAEINQRDPKSYKEFENKSLPDVCQGLKDLDEGRYIEVITNALKGFEPLNFHHYITDYKWQNIFTVDIDDLVEKVFKKQGQKIQVFYKSDNSDKKNSKAQCLFKLHGCANHPENGIVFARSEYFESIANSTDFRLLQLTCAFNSNCFFVIGTEMREADIEYFKEIYKKSGSSLVKFPVVFVNPKPSRSFENMVKKDKRFKLLRCTAEDFLNFLHEECNTFTKTYYTFKSLQKRNKLLTIETLKEGVRDEESTYMSKLYFGNAPVWNDLFFDFIIEHSGIIEAKNIIHSSKKRVIIFYGSLYSGKTSLLMRLYSELSRNREFLCLYNAADELSLDRIRHLMKNVSNDTNIEKIYLFYDDVGEDYSEFEKVLQLDSRIILVGTSYELIHRRKKYALDTVDSELIAIKNDLADDDIGLIKEKFDEKGLSGELIQKDVLEWEKIINKTENIVSALYKITESLTFRERFEEIITSSGNFKEHKYYKILLIAAMCYKVGIPYIRSEMLAADNIYITKKLVEDCCDYLTITENNAIKIKSSFIADAILKIPDLHSDMKKSVINICISISSNIKERGMSYHKKVYEYLTKFRYLKNILCFSNNDIIEIYSELKKYYSEMSYYWLQLGLVEQNENEFKYALRHFRSANKINPRSYGILHALARNYCKEAQCIDSKVQSRHCFEEGTKKLLELIENDLYLSSKSYAVHSLIYETIHYYTESHLQFPNDKILFYKELLKEAMEKDNYDDMMVQLDKKFTDFCKCKLKDNDINYIEYENNLDY